MHSVITLAATLALSRASYVLVEDYNASSLDFFDKFIFSNLTDPTNGAVNYVDKTTALNFGLVGLRDGQVYMGVDTTNQETKRSAVRIEGTESYTHGLFISDITHMPGGICGTWPSWWMLGDGDPAGATGEIDIIENVNSADFNQVTLWEYQGACNVDNSTASGVTSGLLTNLSCSNVDNGCETDDQTGSFGQPFNDNGGGVYALEWTSSYIAIYFIPRSMVEDSATGPLGSTPDPQSWGIKPVAYYSGSCDLDKAFQKLHMIFNITFCGDSAGKGWSSDAVCMAKADTCDEFVANNPSAFTEAYWLLKSVKVYQMA